MEEIELFLFYHLLYVHLLQQIYNLKFAMRTLMQVFRTKEILYHSNCGCSVMGMWKECMCKSCLEDLCEPKGEERADG